jgi:glyoxylase-like metal-dependent hydrolase (beta-lactamase superfamily II)
MISDKTGHVARGLYVCGLAWSPVLLLDGSRPVIFEAGFACAAQLYERELRQVLGERKPEILFLTHVHWDHCGATDYLRRAFPGLKVAASARAAAIVARPSAQRRIIELGRTAIPVIRTFDGVDGSLLIDEPFRPFDVNIALHDGQVVQVDKDTTVEVLATPGHTRDHLSYYIPERKILIGGEAAGCLEPGGGIDVEFLADYDAYLASLARLLTIPAEIFAQGHNYLFVGRESVKVYLGRSIKAAEDFATRVHELLRVEGGSIERVVNRIKVEQHDPKPGPKQPDEAFLLNLTAQVTHLAARKPVSRNGETAS